MRSFTDDEINAALNFGQTAAEPAPKKSTRSFSDDEIRAALSNPQPVQQAVEDVEQPKPDTGAEVSDIGVAATKGTLGMVQYGYGIANVLTAGLPDYLAARIGGVTPTETMKAWQDKLHTLYSVNVQERKRKAAQIDEDAPFYERWYESAKNIAKDPVLLGLMAVETAPQLATVFGGAGMAAKGAFQASMAAGLGRGAAIKAAEKASVRASLGINTALESGSAASGAREDILTMPEKDIRQSRGYINLLDEYGDTEEGRKLARLRMANESGAIAASVAAPISFLSNKFTGAGKMEAAVGRFLTGKTLAKEASEGIKDLGISGLAKGAVRGGLKEGSQESIENPGSELGQNLGDLIAKREDVTYEKLSKGLFESSGQGFVLGFALGIPMGGVEAKGDFRRNRAEQVREQVKTMPDSQGVTVQPATTQSTQNVVDGTAPTTLVAQDGAVQPDGEQAVTTRNLNLGSIGERIVTFENESQAALFDLGIDVRKLSRTDISEAHRDAIKLEVAEKVAALGDQFGNASQTVKAAFDYRNAVIGLAGAEPVGSSVRAIAPGTVHEDITVAVSQMNREFGLPEGETIQITPVYGDVRLNQFSRLIKESTGTNTHIVDFTTDKNGHLLTNKGRVIPSGFAGMKVAGRSAILLTPKTTVPQVAIHELVHELESKHPDLFGKLKDAAVATAPQEARNAFKTKLESARQAESGQAVSEALFVSELVAEISQEQGDKTTFDNLFTHIGDKGLVRQVIESINNFINKILKSAGFQGPQFIKDREKAIQFRNTLNETFKEWSSRYAVQKQGAGTNDVGQAPGGGQAVGEGNAQPQVTAGEGQVSQAGTEGKAGPVTVSEVKQMRPGSAGYEAGDTDGTWTRVTLSNGKVRQIIRLNSTESMGLPGWHDNEKLVGSVQGAPIPSYLGENKEEAVAEILKQEQTPLFKRIKTRYGYLDFVDNEAHAAAVGLIANHVYAASLQEDPVALENEYIDLVARLYPEAPRVINTDEARILSPFYEAYASDLSPAVHEPASALVKRVYDRYLREADPKKDSVLFLAGGGGSGKGTIQRQMKLADENVIVYDGVMSGVRGALDKISKATEAGLKTRFVYVNTPAMQAFDGSLDRAERKGRVVPLMAMVEAHKGASDTVRELFKRMPVEVFNHQYEAPFIAGTIGDVYSYILEELQTQFQERLEEKVANEGYPVELARAVWPEGPWSESGLRGLGERIRERKARQDLGTDRGPTQAGTGTGVVEDAGQADQAGPLQPPAGAGQAGAGGNVPTPQTGGGYLAASRVPRSTSGFMSDPDLAKDVLGLTVRNKVRDIGEALNRFVRERFGVINDKDNSEQAKAEIASAMVEDLISHFKANPDSGVGWYSVAWPKAMRELGKVFPELRTSKGARGVFTALLAVTSNGEKVDINTSNAIKIYREMRLGRRPTSVEIGSRRADSLSQSLAEIEVLLDTFGPTKMTEFLMEQMTVKEINAALRSQGKQADSAYPAAMVVPRAALYFGPKLGAFYANLNGAEGYLTMDLWWSRTFNRIRGTLVPQPTNSIVDRVRGLLVGQGFDPSLLSDEESVVDAAIPFHTMYKERGFKEGSDLEVSANTLVKSALLELNEAPFRATDRRFMLDTTIEVQRRLAEEHNINLSVSDIQAALWYYEKRLYSALGKKGATDDIDYAKAVNDYSNEHRPERRSSFFDRKTVRWSEPTAEAAQDVATVPEPGQAERPAGGPAQGQAVPGDQAQAVTFSRIQEGTPEFEKYFRDSPVVNRDGSPKVMYHGTQANIKAFKARQDSAVYVSPNPKFAEYFAMGEHKLSGKSDFDLFESEPYGANIMPVYAAPQTVFDASKKSDLEFLKKELLKSYGNKAGMVKIDAWLPSGEKKDNLVFHKSNFDKMFSNGDWYLMESPQVQEIIKKNYEGFYTKETAGKVTAKNLAVYNPNLIKSATGNRGTFDTRKSGVAFSRSPIGFYSALSDGVDSIKMGAAQSTGWKDAIKGLLNKGQVKAEEVEWTGINDWLNLQKGKVTKEQVQNYLQNNGVEVDSYTVPYNDIKYKDYSLPGGENYREILLRLPGSREDSIRLRRYIKTLTDKYGSLSNTFLEWTKEEEAKYNSLQDKSSAESKEYKSGEFKSSHWSIPNVLAHIRTADHADVNNKRVLFIDEIQSDWGQKGKSEGFKSVDTSKIEARFKELWAEVGRLREEFDKLPIASAEKAGIAEKRLRVEDDLRNTFSELQKARRTNTPPGPFVTKTEGWLNLSLKNIITMAVEGGYDKVAFVNGRQSADRYNLRKQIDEVSITKQKNGSFTLVAYKDREGGKGLQDVMLAESGIPIERISELVGKDLAKKAKEQPEGDSSYRDIDLEIGGEGMKAFYDQIVPIALKKLLSKVGGRLGTVDLTPETLAPSNEELIKTGSWLPTAGWLSTGIPQKGGPVAGVQSGFDVTQEMRDAVSNKGMPLFSRADYNEQQLLWLDQKAVDEGYPNIDALAAANIGRFVELANEYRIIHPEQDEEILFSRANIEKAISDPKNDKPLVISDFPTPVMSAVGFNELPLIIKGSTIRKLATGKDGTRAKMNSAQIEKLGVMIGDPAAVFENANRDDSMVFLLNARMGGLPLIASVEMDSRQRLELKDFSTGKVRVADALANEVNTSYPMDSDSGILNWLKDGRLRYWDRTKVAKTYPTLMENFRKGEFKAGDRGFTVHNPQTATEPVLASRTMNFGDITPEQEQSLRDVGAIVDRVPFKQRLNDLKQNFRKKAIAGIADQFHAFKAVDNFVYMKLRLAKATDGALEAMLMYGKPYLEDGVVNVDFGQEGFGHLMADLGEEMDRFLEWMAAHRADRLKGTGLEFLYSQTNIDELKKLDEGTMKDGRDRAETYKNAQKRMMEFNEAVLKIANERGLIDDVSYNLYKEHIYIPFYRVLEGQETGPKTGTSMLNKEAWKALKGGPQKLNQDKLNSVLMNWSHLLQASSMNKAAADALDFLANVYGTADNRVARVVPAGTKGAVTVKDGGVSKHYIVDDPDMLAALQAIDYRLPKMFEAAAVFKHWLTWGVTVNPAFKLRNLMRDLITSAALDSNLSANPLENLRKGIPLTSKNTQTYASMLAGGGIIRFGTLYDTSRAKHTRRMINKLGGHVLEGGALNQFVAKLEEFYDIYQDFGDRGENINRAALYKTLREQGKTHLEANFMARDLMDFSLQGSAPVVRFLTATVPFLNARIQGLYKLGRSATEREHAGRWRNVVGAVALASVALAMLQGDDEDWDRREQWDKDTYWWFKIGGVAYRIPKPFEIGSIGSVAERGWELLTDKDTTLKVFGKSLGWQLSQNFNFGQLPQFMKPIYEVAANRSGFTDRPIENLGMQRMLPQDRVTPYTSGFARLLGQVGLPNPASIFALKYDPLSPVQIDHLLRGYFGWLGSSTAMVADSLTYGMQGRGEKPDMRLKDIFLIGNFAEGLPSGSSKYVTALYEQASDIEKVYGSLRAAMKRGDEETAISIRESNAEELRKRRMVENVKGQLSKINQQIRTIHDDKVMSGAEKRARIDALEQRRDEASKRAVSID